MLNTVHLPEIKYTVFTINVLRFRTFFSFCSQKVSYQAWNSQKTCQNSKQEDPDKPASFLIWDCTVCLGLFGRQVVLEFLDHIP